MTRTQGNSKTSVTLTRPYPRPQVELRRRVGLVTVPTQEPVVGRPTLRIELSTNRFSVGSFLAPTSFDGDPPLP